MGGCGGGSGDFVGDEGGLRAIDVMRGSLSKSISETCQSKSELLQVILRTTSKTVFETRPSSHVLRPVTAPSPDELARTRHVHPIPNGPIETACRIPELGISLEIARPPNGRIGSAFVERLWALEYAAHGTSIRRSRGFPLPRQDRRGGKRVAIENRPSSQVRQPA